jgi:hypothetical protein
MQEIQIICHKNQTVWAGFYNSWLKPIFAASSSDAFDLKTFYNRGQAGLMHGVSSLVDTARGYAQ